MDIRRSSYYRNIAAALLVGLGIGYLGRDSYEWWQAEQLNLAARTHITATATRQMELFTAESDSVASLMPDRIIPVWQGDAGMGNLTAINPDIVGWISFIQAEIDYPVVRGVDNSFYLTHAYDKSQSRYGSIMMNCDNETTFDDVNTILYGHDTWSGSMFGSLKNLLNTEEEIEDITIRTLQGEKQYRVVCIAKVDNEEDVFQIELSQDQFVHSLRQLQDQALYWQDQDVDPGDCYLTLVTCSDEQKLIVIAKSISA